MSKKAVAAVVSVGVSLSLVAGSAPATSLKAIQFKLKVSAKCAASQAALKAIPKPASGAGSSEYIIFAGNVIEIMDGWIKAMKKKPKPFGKFKKPYKKVQAGLVGYRDAWVKAKTALEAGNSEEYYLQLNNAIKAIEAGNVYAKKMGIPACVG